ncbi:sensor domain-containing protein [Edaphobacillus lindanitolerans]|uniref:PAS domain S-box-containing protein/diguanylate cyclase (GGDEF) domain-containing protein n=1 Tax=Edaphobacillus lindanitolerans TaxID=550447 RepID=A0A1U7PPX3_9BACI|nr:diguanylate cyclase [Edaphobacillus lindanitolerans]SIT89514.1 PAS domain S-box-containing protein/diguanylate cyclase (GGDEF) domain-containing protein [Edaphobacillus lindanitolerans]
MGGIYGNLPERVLVDGMTDMVFVMAIREDGKMVYEFFNRTARNTLGINEEIIGRTISDALGDVRGQLLEPLYREVADTGISAVYSDEYPDELGKTRYSETTLVPLFEEGTCTHIVATVRDVTEKIAARRSATLLNGRLELSGSKFRALFENNSDAVFELSADGTVLAANPAAGRLFGKPEKSFDGRPFAEVIGEGWGEREEKAFRSAHSESEGDIRVDVCSISGPVGCLLKFTPVMNAGTQIGCYAHLKDMRELDKLVGQFMESERRFRIIAEHVRDLILLVDKRWNFLYVSPSIKTVFGFTPDELSSSSGEKFVFPEDEPRLRETFDRTVLDNGVFTLRLRLAHAERGWVWAEMTGSAVYGSDGRFLHMVLVIRDITRQKEEEELLHNYAYHDPLTGLPNRRLFFDRLEQRLERYRMAGEPFAIILMDIDNFKQINDNWGHETGDEVIRAFGVRISGALEDGLVARYGGDEFVALIAECRDADEAAATGRRILDSLKSPLRITGREILVTTSLGIALSAPGRMSPEELLRLADRAMYHSKKEGSGRYRII